MKSAVLADIHGNSIALERVLEDIQRTGGVDEYWVLGDLAAIGPDPLGAMERVVGLPGALFVRGNTDRYLVSGELPGPPVSEVEKDPSLAKFLIHLARSFSWTAGAVTAGGWLPWLKRLPLEMRIELPDGTRVLAVHASPGKDDGHGIHPGMSDDDLRPQLAQTEADLILVGHTHTPFDRRVEQIRLVNPGSVSNPLGKDLRASYLLIQADNSGYNLEFRKVPYDLEAVIDLAQEVKHPAAKYITRLMRGQERAPWVEEAS